MDDIRALIEKHLMSVDEITERYGVSLSGFNMWTRGAVPAGAPPFPDAVKVGGKSRLYIDLEVEPWISAYHQRRK